MSWKRTVDGADVVLEHPGKIGRNCKVDNAHHIRLATHRSGSGPEAFSGANVWPVVEVEVAFQEGEEALAVKLAREFELMLNQWFFNHSMR